MKNWIRNVAAPATETDLLDPVALLGPASGDVNEYIYGVGHLDYFETRDGRAEVIQILKEHWQRE